MIIFLFISITRVPLYVFQCDSGFVTISCSLLVDLNNLRPPRTNRNHISIEESLGTGSKKAVISVVLTEEEALPGWS